MILGIVIICINALLEKRFPSIVSFFYKYSCGILYRFLFICYLLEYKWSDYSIYVPINDDETDINYIDKYMEWYRNIKKSHGILKGF